jgi:hypothetical protein
LTEIQQQLLRTGMDSQIVGADIVRYAQDEASWRRDILDFNEVSPPALARRAASRASLAETMRQGQINQGDRVTQAEADLRELLNTSAQLTAATENLRLQRRVLWLTIASLIVAAVAATAAVVALRMSGNTPPATPRRPCRHPAGCDPSRPAPGGQGRRKAGLLPLSFQERLASLRR